MQNTPGTRAIPGNCFSGAVNTKIRMNRRETNVQKEEKCNVREDASGSLETPGEIVSEQQDVATWIGSSSLLPGWRV